MGTLHDISDSLSPKSIIGDSSFNISTMISSIKLTLRLAKGPVTVAYSSNFTSVLQPLDMNVSDLNMNRSQMIYQAIIEASRAKERC